MLKRLMLPQGRLDQIYDGEEGMRYMAVCEFLPGSPRGNHVHQVKNEYLYLISGEAELRVEDPLTRECAGYLMKPGNLAFIPTGVAHVIRPQVAGLGIEFSTTRFDPADTQRYALAW